MTTTTYKPLTLTTRRDGNKYGEVTLYGVEYGVKVVSQESGRYVHVYVVGGSIKTYQRAGLLVKRAIGLYRIKAANADGTINTSGYSERGKIVDLVQRVVVEFASDVEYREREAAKTPEEKAAEAQARENAIMAGQQRILASRVEDLLKSLDDLVPSSTVHYAVEDARRALNTLAREVNTIKTKGSDRG